MTQAADAFYFGSVVVALLLSSAPMVKTMGGQLPSCVLQLVVRFRPFPIDHGFTMYP
jgi:hypothetical protein